MSKKEDKSMKPRKNEIKKYIKQMQNDVEKITIKKKMSWELLVQIKAYVLSSPSYKHAMESLGIYKTTWYRWNTEGKELLKSLEDKQITFKDLDERGQQLITFVYILSVSRPEIIRKAWNKLTKMADKDFRALQFQLKILDPETFNVESKMKVSGYLDSNSEEESKRISNVLSGFMPKDGVEDLNNEDVDIQTD